MHGTSTTTTKCTNFRRQIPVTSVETVNKEVINTLSRYETVDKEFINTLSRY
jgi:folate-dependent tRNA-U54 methylase TrmFO/GidA